MGHFKDDLARMPNNFSRNINKLSSNSGGVGAGLNYRTADIQLESFVQKKGNNHRVVEGGIMAKTFEWQLLTAEIFQRTVHQLIAATFMVALNQPLRCKKITAATSLEPFIYGTAHAQVGVK